MYICIYIFIHLCTKLWISICIHKHDRGGESGRARAAGGGGRESRESTPSTLTRNSKPRTLPNRYTTSSTLLTIILTIKFWLTWLGSRGSSSNRKKTHSRPCTRNPQPETLYRVPETAKPATRNPNPETRNPKLATRNPKLKTRNPKPETRNLKPETRNPKPESRRAGLKLGSSRREKTALTESGRPTTLESGRPTTFGSARGATPGEEEVNTKRGLESEEGWEDFAEGHVSDSTLIHKDAVSRLEKVLCTHTPNPKPGVLLLLFYSPA